MLVVLDPATYRRLSALAAAAGQSCASCAASLLRAVVEDDAAAHGEVA
ncbi:hypothetical protein [Ancylobacter lacus]|nr:hypothetical protein [Ancylobacter lacus]MBS7539739.1 hypothetical protein [Ancylobacter lacus]